jgi:autotransporter-associated beta strand protein
MHSRPLTIALAALLGLSLQVPEAYAATASWTGANGGDWNTAGNWSAKPGASDTALFNISLGSVTNATADQSVGSISFDTGAGTTNGTFTIGTTAGNKLTLGSAGTVQILSTLAGTGKTITINSPIVLTPASTTTAGAYTFANNSADTTNTLNFGGAISASTTSNTETLTLNGSNTGNNTISGAISKGSATTFALTKSGLGTWVLAGSNSYNGATTINQGTLKLDFSAAGAPTSNIINNTANSSGLSFSGGTLLIVGKSGVSNTQQFNGISLIRRAGPSAIRVIQNGATAVNVTLGAIAVRDPADPSGTFDFTLPTAGSISTTSTTFASGANKILVDAAANGAAFATVDGMTWATNTSGVIGALSTYQSTFASATADTDVTGNLAIDSGTTTTNTLRFNTAGMAVGAATTGTLAVTTGGILVTGAATGNTGISSGVVLTSAAARGLTILNNAAATGGTFTVGANIIGTGGLNITGPGTTVLSGSSSYGSANPNGNTYIRGGTVNLSGTITSAGSFNVGSPLTADATTNATVNLTGALGTASTPYTGLWNIYAGSTFNESATGFFNSSSTSSNFYGAVSLSGSNIFSGIVTINNASTLTVGNAYALGTSGTLVFYNGYIQASTDMSDTNALKTNWGVTGGKNVTFTGTNNITLSGNGYGGTTAGGNIINNITGSGALVISGSLGLVNGATGGQTTNLMGNGNATISGNITDNIFSGTGTGNGLKITNTGTTTLSGSNSYTGATQINAGTLQIGDGGTTGSLSISSAITDNATLTFNRSDSVVQGTNFANTIGGTGKLIQAGAGTLTLSSSNSYSGGTTISAGTLVVSSTASLGATSGALTFSGNGALQLGASFNTARNYVVNSGVTATVDTQAYSQTNSGIISGLGGIAKSGAGTLVLNGANTYYGGTVINNGTVQMGNASALGDNSGSLTMNGGVLDLNKYDLTVTGISGSNGAAITNSAIGTSTLTVSGMANSTYSGALNNGGINKVLALAKYGIGELTLTGANTYTGATTISSGKLNVDGSLAAASAVNIASGASLGGHGTVGALSGAGLVTPGNSPGILTAASVDPSSDLSFAFEFTLANTDPIYSDAASSGNDILHLTDVTPFLTDLGVNNTISVYLSDITNGSTYLGGFFTSLSAADLLTAVKNANLVYYVKDTNGTIGFNNNTYSLLSNSQVTLATVDIASANFASGTVGGSELEFTVVPEPATWSMLIGGMGMMALVQRMRRRIG